MPQPKIDVDKLDKKKVDIESLKKAIKDKEKAVKNNTLIQK